jgi:hypothetical protein
MWELLWLMRSARKASHSCSGSLIFIGVRDAGQYGHVREMKNLGFCRFLFVISPLLL